ncbi:hypothetical protein CBY_3449 [Clostridium butyricum 5521]|uniref:Uncharacterized protein n=1 Tax=Clostridium butyricum E4 str. BoNT E BL5262 TaxID=632245 RepID=C4IK35_CLOBU|nr:hypothetical protein CBY_3449 [Clostridium butyricum 5521]EEP53411.1 hypothetical protein CLP_1164 [Clostridium butyricum E4 str. BoNT E BL5262]EMU55527.1 hypothetical protein CBDKU1_06260 [Clostridium butyricum DKU-01]
MCNSAYAYKHIHVVLIDLYNIKILQNINKMKKYNVFYRKTLVYG